MTNVKIMLEYTKFLNVLYVEDDIELLAITKELFDVYFNSIDVAYNGEEGLNKYRNFYKEHNSYYDIVITDVNMPLMNGINMSKEILKQNNDQSIIITSAHNDIENLTAAINLGIDGFLIKPVKNDALIKAIHKISQAIGDHKLVLSHLEMIEELNTQLQNQNDELTAKNNELEKSFRMLDTMVNKEKIINPPVEIATTTEQTPDDLLIHEQIESLVHDDLDELKEIHGDIDLHVISIINNVSTINTRSVEDLISNFSRYSSILSFYNFFDQLSTSMSNFSNTLKNNPLPEDTILIQNIFTLLESFMYVLGKWQDDLSLGNANTINSLDASIISDMHTITNMWTQVEEEVAPEDLDDIFDF